MNKAFYFNNNEDTRKDKRNSQNIFDKKINFTLKYSSQ